MLVIGLRGACRCGPWRAGLLAGQGRDDALHQRVTGGLCRHNFAIQSTDERLSGSLGFLLMQLMREDVWFHPHLRQLMYPILWPTVHYIGGIWHAAWA